MSTTISTNNSLGVVAGGFLVMGASLSGLIYIFQNFHWLMFGMTFLPLIAILIIGFFLVGTGIHEIATS